MNIEEGYLLDDRYKLKQFIGNGSFGEVWVAYDVETDLEVAVKIYLTMDSAGIDEFKTEFQLTFDLNHTNLLHAYYLGISSDENRPYLVMPLCPEGSVSKQVGKMSESDLWKFIRDVSSGLAYLHEQNPPVIHQDIKPDNILKSKNGDYQITDFGISKKLKSSMKRTAGNLNSAGAIAYMGPERFGKNFHSVKASDIWSLGATLYELATGELPFCGMGGSMQKNGADMPHAPEGYSKELGFIILSCLAKETWERPTARHIQDYASAIINGKEPDTPWIKKDDLSIDSTVRLENNNSNPIASTTPLKSSKPTVSFFRHNSERKSVEKNKDVKEVDNTVGNGVIALILCGAAILGVIVGMLLKLVF